MISKTPVRTYEPKNPKGTIGVVCGAVADLKSFEKDIIHPLVDMGYEVTTIAQQGRGFCSEARLLDNNHEVRDHLIQQGNWGEANGPDTIIAQSIGVNIELAIYNANGRTGINSILALTPGFPHGLQWVARNYWDGLYNAIATTQMAIPAKCILGSKDFVNGTNNKQTLEQMTAMLEKNGWKNEVWPSGHLLNNNRYDIFGIGTSYKGTIPQSAIKLIEQSKNS